MLKQYYNSLLIISFILIVLIFKTPLVGVIYHSIDTATLLECSFSSIHHNRIMVEESSVKKIISAEEKVCIRLEEDSGQAFIYLLDPNLKNVTLSVVTNEAEVQDISITFVERSSEVIILRPSLQSTLEKNNKFITCKDSGENIQEALSIICHGYVPSNYCRCSFPSYEFQTLNGINLNLQSILKGEGQLLYVFKGKNSSSKKKTIFEKELETKGSRWIYLEKNNLNAGDSFSAILALEDYEQ